MSRTRGNPGARFDGRVALLAAGVRLRGRGLGPCRECGRGGPTVKAITDEAGVNRALFHYHFGDVSDGGLAAFWDDVAVAAGGQ